MKMMKIIPMSLFILLLSVSLPVMAADKSMKDEMTTATGKNTMMKKDSMKSSDTMEEKNMMTDTMEKKAMMADTRTAMLDGADGHHAAGKVAFTHEMGHDLLVLSGIKVDEVPDGHVYLAKQGDRKKGVELGVLKQFSGNVTFKLPEGTDPKAYDSVIIYCEKFDVEIGRAELKEKM